MQFDANTTAKQVVETFKAEIEGRTFVITGPSKSSLGAESAISLANANPKRIILAGRTEAKISPVIEEIRRINPTIQAEFLQLDLSSNASVREAAQKLNDRVDRIDVMINSAGIMAARDRSLTVDGIESQFAASFTGHFLFVNLLVDKLLKASNPRVVTVSSNGYMLEAINLDDPNFENREYNAWKSYAQAKTANILHAVGLTKKHGASGLKALAAVPGYVPDTSLQANTGVDEDLFREGMELGKKAFGLDELPPLPERSLQEGCASMVLAGVDPKLGDSAPALVFECSITPGLEYATSEENAEKLWTLGEKLTS